MNHVSIYIARRLFSVGQQPSSVGGGLATALELAVYGHSRGHLFEQNPPPAYDGGGMNDALPSASAESASGGVNDDLPSDPDATESAAGGINDASSSDAAGSAAGGAADDSSIVEESSGGGDTGKSVCDVLPSNWGGW